MANRFFDRERYGTGYEEEGRYGRGSDYERYNQGYSGSEPYYRGSNSPYGDSIRSYGNDNYGNYGRGDSGNRYGEGWRGYEERYSDPYYRNRMYRGFNRGWEDQGGNNERGFWDRAGDEVRSWFGDEEAERRRQQDEFRSQYAGRGPKGYKRSDDRIREDVNERLTGDYYLDANDIDVSVSDCVVTLTGRVENRRDKRRAENLAESVRGVMDINNQLRVSPESMMTTNSEPYGSARAKAAKT